MVDPVRIGVACLIVQQSSLLLGKRKNAHSAGTWAVPGGHLEHGERIAECAARELKEETGLIATSSQVLDFVENFLDSGSKHYITFFVALETLPAAACLLEPEKCEGWNWFPINALPHPLIETLSTYLNKRALEGRDPFKSSNVLQSADD